ncbi:MAG: hypothetical protein KBG25_07465 [Paludibacteraceae bacterium]|jgi:hypothetical protein|nr:hypothetical protein [Paludibacteraceae bacterium]
MTAEDIFNEVMKSPELTDIFNIPQEVLNNLDYNASSEYQVIEVIKAIIRGEENHMDSSAIFRSIQNQIIHLG